MRNLQEYDFQRIAAKKSERPTSPLCNNSIKAISDFKLSSLEKRIEALEKKLHYYEELLTIKNNELAKFQADSNLIQETFKRITHIEESFYQYTANDYSLKQIDVENLINEKLNPLQISINKKLNDITIMMQDLSQYNTTQQRQFLNFKEAQSSFDETLNENSAKIKELSKQFLSILNMFNDSSNEDEELFLRNICKK